MNTIVMNRKKISQTPITKGPHDEFSVTADYTDFLEGDTIAEVLIETDGDAQLLNLSHNASSVSFYISGATYDQRISVKITTVGRNKYCRKIPINIH